MKNAFKDKLINKEFAVTMEDEFINRIEEKGSNASLEIGREIFNTLKEITNVVHFFPMGDIDLVQSLFEEGVVHNE